MAADSPLLSQILQLAPTTDWRIAHARPALTSKGWRTALSGDMGFPDLTLAKSGVCFHLEVKSQGGYPSAHQVGWLRELPFAFAVYPCHFDAIQHAMRKMSPGYLYQHCALARSPEGLWVGSLAKWATKKFS